MARDPEVLGGVSAPRTPRDAVTGDAGSADAVSIGECTIPAVEGTSDIACPRCGSLGPHPPGPGAGPHHARLVCGVCGWFLRWLPKPRAVQGGAR